MPVLDPPRPPLLRSIGPGAVGDDVRAAGALMLSALGRNARSDRKNPRFTAELAADVRAVQSRRGLPVTGVIGTRTWAALWQTRNVAWKRAAAAAYARYVEAHTWTPAVLDITDGRHPGFERNGSWQERSLPIPRAVGHYTGGMESFEQDNSYHRSLGWPGLSYHIAIRRDGQLLVVNRPEWLTWHARGLNTSGIGVSCTGTLDIGPSPEQMRTVLWLADQLRAGTFPGFPRVAAWTTHKHAAYIDPAYSTDCPGPFEALYKRAAGAGWVDKPTSR